MARPYQFNDPDRVTSPLDRQPPATLPASQAPSFKTNVNRNKTRKWVEAPSYSYEGDDWGGYDEHDEYGVEQPPVPTGQSTSAGRNFTGPPAALNRQTSFDKGDERRVFSAGTAPAASSGEPLSVVAGNPHFEMASPAPTDATSASSINPEHRRDFSPSAMPPPLQTIHPSAATTSNVASPIVRPPSAGAYDPRSVTPTSATKALPFVRPADIYKRMEEAREQERRESLDSVQSGADDPSRARAGSSGSLPGTTVERLQNEAGRPTKATLASVPERKSEYGLLDQKQPSSPTKSGAPLRLPADLGGPSFGEDFWGSTSTGPAEKQPSAVGKSAISPTTAPNQAQAVRAMVGQAFDRSDSTGNVSKQDSVRTQTTESNISSGTSDISPILSRVNGPAMASTEKPLPKPIGEAAGRREDAPLPPPPVLDSATSSRSASPSKGRVRDLANQINTAADSRRSSVQSVGSRKSVQEVRSTDPPTAQAAEIINSGQTIPSNPSTEQALERPKIPGGWQSSYTGVSPVTTSAAGSKPEVPPKSKDDQLSSLQPPRTDVDALSEDDIAPTTAKQVLDGKDHTGSRSGALAALSAAGAAMGDAFMNSLGTGNDDVKPLSPTAKPVGDVHNTRPLPERLDTSATSTTDASEVPPTPPAKPGADIPPPVPLKSRTTPETAPLRLGPSVSEPHTGSEDSPDDFESDRLRREIVRSLSPADELSNSLIMDKSLPKEPLSPEAILPSSSASGPGLLKKKFSWETSDSSSVKTPWNEGSALSDGFRGAPSPLPLPKSSLLSPDAATEAELAEDNPRLSGEGLHVINTVPGEPDVPVHSMLDAPLVNPTSRFSDTTAAQDSTPRDSASTDGALAGGVGAAGGALAAAAVSSTAISQTTSSAAAAEKTQAQQSYTPSFREIQAMKSPTERISTYNSTRTQWAGMNSGLDNWLTQTLQSHPEHSSLQQDASLSFANSSLGASTGPYNRSPAGHIKSGSIGKMFTSMGASGSNETAGPPADQSAEFKEKRGSATGAGKVVGETLKGLGGKGKGLLGKMGRGRLRGGGASGGGGDGVSPWSSPSTPSFIRSEIDLPSRRVDEELAPSKRVKRTSRSFSPFKRSRPSSVIVPGSWGGDRNSHIPTIPSFASSSRSRRASWIENARERLKTPTNIPPQSAPEVESEQGYGEDLKTPTQSSHGHAFADIDPRTPTAPKAPSSGERSISGDGPQSSGSASSTQDSWFGQLNEAPEESDPISLARKNRIVSMILPADDLGVRIGDDGGVSPIEDEDENELSHQEDSQVQRSENAVSRASQSPVDTWERGSAVSALDTQPGTSSSSRAQSLHRSILGNSPATTTAVEGNARSPTTGVLRRKLATDDDQEFDVSPLETFNPLEDVSPVENATPESEGEKPANIDKGKQPAVEVKGGSLSDQSFRAGEDDHTSLDPEHSQGAGDLTASSPSSMNKRALAEPDSESPSTIPPKLSIIHTDHSQEPASSSDEPSPENNVSQPDRFLRPKNSIGARSMPSISSMGPSSDRSEEQSPVEAPAPAISPIRPQFEVREYNPPNPALERPMSFVPLPRDSSGQLHEHINVHRPEEGSRHAPRRTSRVDPKARRSSRVLSTLHGVRGHAPSVEPSTPKQGDVGPESARLVVSPDVSHQPHQAQVIYESGSDRQSPDARHPQYQLNVITSPKSDSATQASRPGKFGSLFGKKSGPATADHASGRTLVKSQPDASSPRGTNDPYLSGEAGDIYDLDAEKRKKRSSGFLQPFKRNPSVGTESGFTQESISPTGRSSVSPTPPQYSQHQHVVVGPIHPQISTRNEAKQKLQRASTSGGPETVKKKRFSALGSLFGRSGTTGHATKLDKKQPQPAPPSIPQNPGQMPFQPVLVPGSIQTGPLLAGGYYPPQIPRGPTASGWQHASGASGFQAIEQQHQLQMQQLQSTLDRSSRRTSRHALDPRMGSISEQHQERPWNLNIPAAGDQAADREIIGREIMFAAERRWNPGQQPTSPMSSQGQQPQQIQFVNFQGHQVLLTPQQLHEFQQHQLEQQQLQQQRILYSPSQGRSQGQAPPGMVYTQQQQQQLPPQGQVQQIAAPIYQQASPVQQVFQHQIMPQQRSLHPQQPQTVPQQQTSQQPQNTQQHHVIQSPIHAQRTQSSTSVSSIPGPPRFYAQHPPHGHPNYDAIREGRVVDVLQSLDVQSPSMQSPGVQSPGVQSPGVQSPGVQSPGVQSPVGQTPVEYYVLQQQLQRPLQRLSPRSSLQVQGRSFQPMQGHTVQEDQRQAVQQAPEYSQGIQSPQHVQTVLQPQVQGVQQSEQQNVHLPQQQSGQQIGPQSMQQQQQQQQQQQSIQQPQYQFPQEPQWAPRSQDQAPDVVQIPPLPQDRIPILQPRPQHPGSKLKYEPPSLGKTGVVHAGATVSQAQKAESRSHHSEQTALVQQTTQGETAPTSVATQHPPLSYHPPSPVEIRSALGANQRDLPSVERVPVQRSFESASHGSMTRPEGSDIPPPPPPKIPLHQVNTQVQQIHTRQEVQSPSSIPLPPTPSIDQRDPFWPANIPLPQSATTLTPMNTGYGPLPTIRENMYADSRSQQLPPSYSQPDSADRVPIIQIPTAGSRPYPRTVSAPLSELPGSSGHHVNQRYMSPDEDAPVMKAVSYPGDEWIPEWNGD